MARPLAKIVSEIMSTELITVTPGTRLDQALEILMRGRVRRLPVVDETSPGKLRGIITDRDLRLACDSPFLHESLSQRVKHLADHKVEQIMKAGIVTVEDSASILEAAKLMRVSKVSGLPVVDKTGLLVGVCTMTDLLDHLIRVLEPIPPADEK